VLTNDDAAKVLTIRDALSALESLYQDLERQRTFFLNSRGCGAQYTAVAQHASAEARRKGLGHEIPMEWFVESIW